MMADAVPSSDADQRLKGAKRPLSTYHMSPCLPSIAMPQILYSQLHHSLASCSRRACHNG
jgi:hypothetical protein